jgi:CRISPR-associated protein (TIGR03984 family)
VKTAWRHMPESHPAKLLQRRTVTGEALADLRQWLQEQAQTRNLQWLLAHADDGIIWGCIDAQGQLLLSRTALEAQQQYNRDYGHENLEITTALQVCPVLRIETLQQARLFAAHAELLLWRDGDNAFHARLIQDSATAEDADWLEAFDEAWMLWGTHGLPLPHGFTLWRDGAQGLRHVIPWPMRIDREAQTEPPHLIVRHYLAREEIFARVVISRLVVFTEEANT